MGKASRDKGARNERKVVNLMLKANVPARRVPLSGASKTHKGDVEFWPIQTPTAGEWDEADWRAIAEETLIAEVKSGAPGELPTKKIARWLEGKDCLVMVEDRQEPLIVLSLGKFMELLA